MRASESGVDGRGFNPRVKHDKARSHFVVAFDLAKVLSQITYVCNIIQHSDVAGDFLYHLCNWK